MSPSSLAKIAVMEENSGGIVPPLWLERFTTRRRPPVAWPYLEMQARTGTWLDRHGLQRSAGRRTLNAACSKKRQGAPRTQGKVADLGPRMCIPCDGVVVMTNVDRSGLGHSSPGGLVGQWQPAFLARWVRREEWGSFERPRSAQTLNLAENL